MTHHGGEPLFPCGLQPSPSLLGVRLYAKSLKAGTPVIQARLGSPTGPVIAQQEVDEFTLCSQATTPIPVIDTFPDGAIRLMA